jgi:hypothetical protein
MAQHDDLAQVAQAWSNLSPDVRAGIVAIVQASASTEDGEST